MKADPSITEEIFKTHDSVVYDAEGFMVCLVHHARRTGWRSVPYAATRQPRVLLKDSDAFALPIEINVSSYTPLEYERLVVFGEVAKMKVVHVKHGAPDMRDNRDPISLVTSTSKGLFAKR